MGTATLEANVSGPGEPVLPGLTVGGLLRRAEAAAPHRVAVMDSRGPQEDRRRWTYRELLARSESLGHWLAAQHAPGDRLAIWAPNIPEYTIFQYAAALAGMVMVTINPALRRREVEYVLRQSQAAACFAYPEFRGRTMLETARQLKPELPDLRDVRDITNLSVESPVPEAASLPEIDPDSVSQIQYTSGTTGAPKAAMLRHSSIVANAATAAHVAGATDGAVWLNPLPMFHVGGCVLAGLGAASVAGTLIPLFDFDPSAALNLIEQEQVTVSNPVPTMLMAMMNESEIGRRDLSSLKSILSGGSPVPPELVRRVEAALGVDFTIIFGQTEASGVISAAGASATPEQKATTCGTPLPGVGVRIVEPSSGELLRTGQPGELQTRGFHTMAGYFDDPAGTDGAFAQGSWLRTGDLCSIGADGYIRYHGRIREVIIRGGENVYPREIEDALREHQAIEDVAVLGLPDPYYGEIVAAFVKGRRSAELKSESLRDFLRSDLAGYKIPSTWVFVSAFPTTASGKLQKFELKRRWEQGEFDHAG